MNSEGVERMIDQKRAAKVELLYRQLAGHVDSDTAGGFTPAEQAGVARLAGVNPPSPTTWAGVLQALRAIESNPMTTLAQVALRTCSYSAYRPEMGVAVAVSVGKPRWKKGTYEWCNPLAPYGIFNRSPRPEYEEYLGLYLARLESGRPAIEAGLTAIARTHPTRALVLCCWCKLDGSEENWCHRSMLRVWARDRLGRDIPELAGAPHPGHLDVQWRPAQTTMF